MNYTRLIEKKKVERSHRIDGKKFYARHRFTSKEGMIKKLSRYNNISGKVLDYSN